MVRAAASMLSTSVDSAGGVQSTLRAALTFVTGSMGSGKTALLIQLAQRHEACGHQVAVLCAHTHIFDDDATHVIASRNGTSRSAVEMPVDAADLRTLVFGQVEQPRACDRCEHDRCAHTPPCAATDDCHTMVVMVDECQFLSSEQVDALVELSTSATVVLFGLVSDISGVPFPASMRAIALGANVVHLESLCSTAGCDGLATMHVREPESGPPRSPHPPPKDESVDMSHVRRVQDVHIEVDKGVYRSVCVGCWVAHRNFGTACVPRDDASV